MYCWLRKIVKYIFNYQLRIINILYVNLNLEYICNLYTTILIFLVVEQTKPKIIFILCIFYIFRGLMLNINVPTTNYSKGTTPQYRYKALFIISRLQIKQI